MARVSNGKLAELWRGRIGRQERSGLSIREYCRREGVSAGSYYPWKRRLSQTAATEHPSDRHEKELRRAPCHRDQRVRHGCHEGGLLCLSQLFQEEWRLPGLLRLRQTEAVRVWQAFEKWADSPSLHPVLPKSPRGKAMDYFRNHRTALKRFRARAPLR